MHESEKRLHPEVIISLSALGILVISTLAFSRKTRNIIKERDHNQSAWSGETGDLEAAHINHSRDNPEYDDASNGRMLKSREHYIDHYNRHERNGLTSYQNLWSLRAIWGRLTGKERQGLPPPDSLE